MRILMIRHAEPDYSSDTLTPRGRKEAALLARRLAGYRLGDVYVSPLGRARETAACALDPLGREAEVLPWLAEFRGRYTDPETGRLHLPWDMPPRVWSSEPLLLDPEKWVDLPRFSVGNIREIWDETVQGVDALMARYGCRKDGPVWHCDQPHRETITLFCHFGISMAVLARLIDVSPVLLWHRSLTVTSSLTEIISEERVPGELSFRVIRLGDITHLESAGQPRSSAGLFPECYTGIDSTDPSVNGDLPWGNTDPGLPEE